MLLVDLWTLVLFEHVYTACMLTLEPSHDGGAAESSWAPNMRELNIYHHPKHDFEGVRSGNPTKFVSPTPKTNYTRKIQTPAVSSSRKKLNRPEAFWRNHTSATPTVRWPIVVVGYFDVWIQQWDIMIFWPFLDTWYCFIGIFRKYWIFGFYISVFGILGYLKFAIWVLGYFASITW